MRVAVISKSDSFGGGASRIAEDLVAGLNEQGHTAVHWVSWTKKGYGPTRRRLYGEVWQRKFYRWARGVKKWFAPDLIPFELPNLYLQNIPENFDVIHFHDLSSAASPLTVQWFAKRMPTVWTFHDCAGFTGGCIYPLACERYRHCCGKCPQHGQWPLDSRFDYSRLKRRVHHRVLHNEKINITVPSQWMADYAMSSESLKVRPQVIANGINTDIFKPPADKNNLRRDLGLPQGRKIVLLVSARLDNPYKGIDHAFRALSQVRDLNPFVLMVGEDSTNLGIEKHLQGLDIYSTGLIGNPAELAAYMGAADLMLFSSLADNQPLVVLESLACGLPVVGYATGGAAEIVEEGKCGILVSTGDEKALATALHVALSEDELRTYAWNATNFLHQKFTRENMIKNYTHYYKKVSGNNGTV